MSDVSARQPSPPVPDNGGTAVGRVLDMRRLSDVYESARVNIPLRQFPGRGSVPTWPDLDPSVRSELEVLKARVLAVVADDDALLASHHRVIGRFNRGLREGLLADSNDNSPDGEQVKAMSPGPYEWGHSVGRRASSGVRTDPTVTKQFVTATHLLAFEFGQLDQAYSEPCEFVERNVGPARADEYGELVFALRVLINYRRALVKKVIESPEFSFVAYHAQQPHAPTHTEYLTHGLVALFDPAPGSWKRAAANLGLAALRFNDGATMQSEDSHAPYEAALAISRRPIAAGTLVLRQVARIDLARSWIGSQDRLLDLLEEERRPMTMRDVYQTIAASVIRSGDNYFSDLVAFTLVHLISDHFENMIPADAVRNEYLRKHLSAFLKGFDRNYEGIVDPLAFASVSYGRQISDGLRRFENGGPLVGAVATNLTELGQTLKELHHALANPVAFILGRLEANQETPIAGRLLALFRARTSLPEELFGENARYEFFSRTQIQSNSAYDLMRSVLFHLTQAAERDLSSVHESHTLLLEAKKVLDRLVQLGSLASKSNQNREIVETGQEFADNFDTLTRVLRGLVEPLRIARLLGKPQSIYESDYTKRLQQERLGSL